MRLTPMLAANPLIAKTMANRSKESKVKRLEMRRFPPTPLPYEDGHCPRCRGIVCTEFDGYFIWERKCIHCARTIADYNALKGGDEWRIRYDSDGNPVAG